MDNLAENSTILDQAFLMSPVGMAVLSSEGDRWVMVNPAFARCLAAVNRSFSRALYPGQAGSGRKSSGDSLYPKS